MEEAAYPSFLCSEIQLNFLLMKIPLLPSAFNPGLVLCFLRFHALKEPLLSQRASSPAESHYSVNTGNPTLDFNKGFGFFFVIFTLDSPSSKAKLPCLIHFFTDAISRNRTSEPHATKTAKHSFNRYTCVHFLFLQLKVKKKIQIYGVERGTWTFVQIEDLSR